jgi:lipid-A-disaccharide synthase
MVASGTVTLEAAFFKTPVVITYKMPWLGYLLFQFMCLVPSIGLPNLLAEKPFLPELLQDKVCGPELARALIPYLSDSPERRMAMTSFENIQSKLGSGSASLKVVEELACLFHDSFSTSPWGETQPEYLDLSGV